ncbi:hypothetical protein [Micromonospora sp. HM5-17]|jgi:hypothetical protein|uniref:hypothetical protein n=1 Tax=Micromonospora sp. HM5-17 TaxID=2487710 RepID=UPI000F466FCA|nr:hypothetical protein [Micromonospora sp. HM5-17]ROT31922.1 hypothetical protein EF879_09740 [Micromonospora sp. HM5-17]
MPTLPRTTRIPGPLYAVAGAGDLAYQQLRRLPAVVSRLGDEATRSELREKAVATTAELREKARATTAELRDRAVLTLRNTTPSTLRQRATGRDFDLDRLREATIRNAAAVVAGAQAAQERALAVYGELVARGERVVGSGVVRAADTVNADMSATEAPADTATGASTASDTPSPAEVAERAETAPTPAKKATSRRRTTATSTRPATTRRTRRTNAE